MNNAKINTSYLCGLKRVIAILLVVALTLGSLDISGFFGIQRFSYADEAGLGLTATSSNALPVTPSAGDSSTPISSANGAELSTQSADELMDGELENDLIHGRMLRSGVGTASSRPSDADLETIGDFLVQDTVDGLIIWGFRDGFTTEDLVIPPTLMLQGDEIEVIGIGEDAFAQSGIKTLVLGEHVKNIGENAFSANEIEELILPNNLETIEKDAFRDNQIAELDLNKVKQVGERAFANNAITSLNMGTIIETIEKEAFRNNDLTELVFPDTLTKVGMGAFTYNNRYVKVTTTLDPLPADVPQKDTVSGGFGYVINPINMTIIHRDILTGDRVAADVVLSSDLTSERDIYVLNMPQTYNPPEVLNYTPLSNPVSFTPDQDDFILYVDYSKTVATINLTRNISRQPTAGPFLPGATDEEVRAALLSLVLATGENGVDLSADVVFGDPNVIQTVKNASEGSTVEVEYILRNSLGEEKRLKLDVLIGTDMRNFPLENGWVLGDFLYGNDAGTGLNTSFQNSVLGFSPQGMAKVNAGKIDVVLPHINPTTGTPVTRVGYGAVPTYPATVGTPFQRVTAIKTVTDFNDNIQKLENNAFNGNKLTSVTLNGVTDIGQSAFLNNTLTTANFPAVTIVNTSAFNGNTGLTDFDLSKATFIGAHAFLNTSLTKVIAPLATTVGSGAFQNTKVGSDPNFLQGFYLPQITKLDNYVFSNAQLTYIDRNEQMPLVNHIGIQSFYINNIVRADITGVTRVDAQTFAFQRNRALSTLIAPNLEQAGASAFQSNSLETLDLPALMTLGGSVFRDNKVSSFIAPNLTTMTGGYNFYMNALTELRLPNLQTASGTQDFSYNLIREAYFDRISVNGLGTEIFFTPDFPYNFSNINAKNPGLVSLGNHVAVYTQTAGVPSKENYIVNPTTYTEGPFTEDDFTWDATDPSIVTGLTNVGKAKLIGNQYNLIIPPRAKIIGERSFNFEGLRSVVASEAVEVRGYAFYQNPLTQVDMPKLTTIGTYAFAGNRGRDNNEKLSGFDFSKVTSLGSYAFSGAGLTGKVSLPLITELQPGVFTANMISSVDAPVLETIRGSGFQQNRLSSLDTTQFPALKRVEGNAFYGNVVSKIDLPNLEYSQGNNEFYFSSPTAPVIWEHNPAITAGSTNKAIFSSNTFNTYVPSGQTNRYLMPGGIILTSPRNPDGSLNRSNPNGYTEAEVNGSSYSFNGRNITPKVRRAVIDPGTVKVNYVIEGSNEPFDGTNGKPLVPSYTEMIYEELEPRIEATGALATHRKYTAADISGYVLVSSTDASGNTVALRKNVDVPFQPLGQRTDRQITYTYRKMETNLNPSTKLDYVIRPSQTVPPTLTHTYKDSHFNGKQVSTEFSLNKIGSNQISLNNAKLIIETDSPYIDLSKTVVANDSTTAALYDPSGVVKTTNGVEISLKNVADLSAVNNVGVNFFFASGLSVPDMTHAHFKIKLVNVVNGVQTVIAEGDQLTAIADNTTVPRLSVNATPMVYGYNYTNTTTELDGPRNMGAIEVVNGVRKVVSNPAPTQFGYSLHHVNYPADQVTLTHVLPTYTAYNPVTGLQETRTATFDAARNPEWELSLDGLSVSSTIPVNNKKGGHYYSTVIGDFNLPRLYLGFPDMIEGTQTRSNVYADIVKGDDPINPTPEPIEHATGDLGIGDSLTISPLAPADRPVDGRDYYYHKTHGYTPSSLYGRAVMYDNDVDRPKEFHYELSMYSTNEVFDMKDVAIIDYGLDQRLRYKRVEFMQTAASAKNMNARVTAYQKVGDVINPSQDTQVISRIVPIATGNSVTLPNTNIDYVKVDIVETESTPLDFQFFFKMVVELKDPNRKLVNGIDPNFFINRAYFTSKTLKKGTEEPGVVKPNDPEKAGIDANFITDGSATVDIRDYKVLVRAEKSLRDSGNASAYQTFPDYASGDAIVGGQEGYYHIRLNSVLAGDTAAKVTSTLENFELYDVFPDGMDLNEDQIILTNEFKLAGGQFEIVGNYATIENGIPVTRRAIRFFSPRLDLSKFNTNPMILARIKTKFIGDNVNEKLTNKIYATWTPKVDVEAQNVAKSGNDNLGPNGQTSVNPWSYSEASIRTKVASALTGNLQIRNRTDYMWTSSIKTESGEAFDYKMTIGQLDANATGSTYRGLELLNIFPGVNDIQLSKSAMRNSQFSNVYDLSRPDDLKVYISHANGNIDILPASSYTISYLNTTAGVDTLLVGKTVDQLSDEAGTWVNAADANTKALKVKIHQDIVLSYGDKLNVEIPMKAPTLNGLNDPIIDKAAVDSFSLRYNRNGNTTPEAYREVNNVENVMEGKKGTLIFQKFGRIGNASPDSTATPLADAVFLLTDMTTGKTKTAISDVNGLVTFADLDVRNRVQVEEIMAPDGFTLNANRQYFDLPDYLTAANNYTNNITQTRNYRFTNIKSISGSIQIIKNSVDANVRIPNITFRVQGNTSLNHYRNTDIDLFVTTEADGTVTLPNMPEGQYVITEIASSEAARFTDMETITVNIDATTTDVVATFSNRVMRLPLRKVITENVLDLDPANWDRLTDFQKLRVGGYRFKIVGSNGTTITPTTVTNNTITNGEVIVPNLTPNVVYTLTEEANQSIAAAKLYEHNPASYKFMFTPDGKLINPDNQRVFRQNAINFPNVPKKIKGKIVVNKVDNSIPARPVAGAKFDLYKITYASNGSIATSEKIGNTKLTVQNGTKAEVIFDNLEPATYQIREIEAAPGYYLGNANTSFVVTIPSTATAANLTDNRYNFNGNEIIFTHNQDVVNKKVSVKVQKGEDLEGKVGITTAEAAAFVAGNPSYRYRVVGTNLANVYKPLSGVVFELYKTQGGVKQGSAIAVGGSTDIVSNANGELNLDSFAFEEHQEYSIFEKTPLSGYERIINPRTFTLANEVLKPNFDGTLRLHINNKKYKGSVLVSKYDSITRRPVAGAKFRLYKTHNAIPLDSSGYIAEVVSGTDGFAYFGNLELGQYTVREYTAPDGYMAPSETVRDRKLTVSETNLNPSYIAFNTKSKDIRITKTWSGGSEASVQVKLMRRASNETTFTPVVAPIVFGTAPNTTNANTGSDGTITLSAATSLTVVIPDMPLANDFGREYIYQVQEISATRANGDVVLVQNNQIGSIGSPEYNVLIGGNMTDGYQIQNIAFDSNKRSVMVTKSWRFADGSITPPPNTKVVIALMKKIGNGVPVEAERKTLDASNQWRHTFTGLEKRNGGQEVTYSVVELSATDGLVNSVAEDVTQATANSNVFQITNTAIKRDKVEFTKNWVGVNPADAPGVVLELYDSEKMDAPMFTQPVTLQADGSLKAIFTDVPSFAYSVEPNATLAENDPNKGRLIARKIKYVVKEKFADGQVRDGYTMVSNLTDAEFAGYSSDANIANSLSFTITNTMAKVNFKVNKSWVGVNAADAPSVQVRLLDVTADTTADLSDTASHITVDTKTLSYHTDVNQSFTATFADLPKYKADGRTLIRYKLVELTQLNGYTSVIDPIVEVDATNRTIQITNTRRLKELSIQKQWNLAIPNYMGASANTPPVRFDIWADMTDDNTINPTPYTQNGIDTENIILDSSNSYAKTLQGLYEYAPNGTFKITYYAKEHAITGYTSPVDGGTDSLSNRTGRIMLTENATSQLAGTFVNTQDLISLHATVIWEGMDMYTAAERANLPVPNIDVYDYTDPNTPRLVRENVPMILEEDPNTPNRARWVASMPNLPKYTADGQRAIVYQARQRQSYTGYRTAQNTDPYTNANAIIDIREPNGSLITDVSTLNTRLADVSVWNAEIVNTPRIRDIKVQKIWVNKVGNEASVYLLRNNERVPAIAGGTTIAPVVITRNTAGQTEEWTYTFKNMPYTAIDGQSVYNYGIEEVDIVNFHKTIELSEVAVPNQSVANILAKVTNTYKTIDITVEKTWDGVDVDDAPPVTLQLVDVTNAAAPIVLTGKTAILNKDNGFRMILEDLPKFEDDGITPKQYSVTETPALAGYTFSTQTTYSDAQTPTSQDGTATIAARNTRVVQNVKVEKKWIGVEESNAPTVEVELFDVTDDNSTGLTNTAVHKSLGKKYLSYHTNPALSFVDVYGDLPKYRPNGTTEIKYHVVETPLAGYVRSGGEVVTNNATLKTSTITNTRRYKDLKIKKTFAMATEIYTNSNTNTPNILVDIYADTTNNGVADPTPYNQVGIQTSQIVLDQAGGYERTIQGLEQFMADGVTEITYYARERGVQGYILPRDFTAATPIEGNGRVKLVDDQGVLSGTLHNVQETVNLVITLNWNGLEHYSDAEIANLPVPTMFVFDVTDPAQPKRVLANVPMQLTEVAGTNRRTWTAELSNLPKYTADGSKAIIYSVSQDEEYDGYTTTEITNPTNADGVIPIREADGSIISDLAVTTQRLSGVTTWRADITNTPKLREVKVVKSWDGPVGSSASIYLKKNNVRINQNPNVAATSYELNAGNQWTKTFVNLPYMAIDGMTRNTYSIEEVPVAGYQSGITMVEEPVANQVSNLRFDVLNTYRTIDITVKKNWTGVPLGDAPQVVMQLVDVTDPANIADVQGQVITLNRQNQFEAKLYDLPKFKADGQTRIEYSVKEVPALDGYDFTVHTSYSEIATTDSPFGTAAIIADNARIKQELRVNKVWDGVEATDAPSVTVELFDVSDDNTQTLSDTSRHISLGTKTLSYHANAAQSFTDVYTNLDKYRADGRTEVRYLLKENTNLAGYTAQVNEIVTLDATHKSIEIRNARKKKSLTVQKRWNLGIENDPNANENTPNVTFDILADQTDDHIVNPLPYTQAGIQTTGLVLSRANGYSLTIDGLIQYTDNGLFEIKYYAKEHDLQGYTESVDATAANPSDGIGRVPLLPVGERWVGTLENTRETIDLQTTLTWNDLDRFTPSDRANLPTPSLRVWDRTDPDNPRLVRVNVPMILVEDMASNRTRWTANMTGLPKYTADGSTAIIYDVEQVTSFAGFTTSQTTNPYQNNTRINIRDANGAVLSDRNTTTANIAPATVWRGEIVNTPLLRDLTVTKTWEGTPRNEIQVYLTRQGIRMHPTLSLDLATTVAIQETMSGQPNPWTYTFKDLPYTLIDGMTIANYGIEELPLAGYTQTVNITEEAAIAGNPGNLHVALHNQFRSVDVVVTKRFSNVDPSLAPSVRLQLIDATDANHPITLTGLVADLHQGNGYEMVFEDLPKFKQDGVTPILYSAIEAPQIAGYRFEVNTIFDNTPTPTSVDGRVLVQATNTLLTRKLQMQKIWEGEENAPRPNARFMLYADTTDDGIENPIQISDIQGVPVDILLTAANGYRYEMDVPKFAPSGTWETKYYISEVPVAGYVSNVADKLLLTPTGAGDTLGGEIRNAIEPIQVLVTNEWRNMDIFGDYDVNDIPNLHITLYDSTDPSHIREVHAEVVLTCDSDGLYKASFANVPRYKSDGITPIVYTTTPREVQDNSLIGYIATNSGPRTDANGNVLIELTMTPRIRNIYIEKKYSGSGEPPDVESHVRLGDVNLFDEPAPINGVSQSHHYGNLSYFEIDGKTERRFMLYSFEPEGYLLDVDFFSTEQVTGVRQFTDMHFVLNLKKGRRPNRGGGGGGEIRGGSSSEGRNTSTPTTPTGDTTPSPQDVLQETSGTLTGENRVKTPDTISPKTSTSDLAFDQDEIIQITDSHGKTKTIPKRDLDRYTFDSQGRIVPKTSDTSNMQMYLMPLLGGLLLLFAWIRRRKKEDRIS